MEVVIVRKGQRKRVWLPEQKSEIVHKHEHYNILRSMSRVGTPTDNAIIEAINGWIKEELFLDFGLATTENVPKLLDEHVHNYNYERPAAALGYKAQFSIKPNWASNSMVFFSVCFSLTDALADGFHFCVRV